jgi:hypothetical protein
MAIILKKLDPKIQPSLIDLPDLESSDSKNKITSPDTTGYKQNRGLTEPFIKIGNIRLPKGQIRSLKILQDELVPRIIITLIDGDSKFSTGKFPISNILISVFIKSAVKKLKNFSCDFIITNINSFNISDREIQYTFIGDMHIPKLHTNISKAFSQVTSLDALLLIANDLQLGFSDNLTENTNDKMTWLIPNYSYKSAITHICKMAYGNEKQFFDCFIDRYYMLNFINVEKQFEKIDDTLNIAYINMDLNNINDVDIANPEKDVSEPSEVTMHITNYPGYSKTELFILEYSLVSNHGEILKNNSLQRNLYWYDHGGNIKPDLTKSDGSEDSANFTEHFIEPLTGKQDTNQTLPQTTSVSEFLDKKTVVGQWVGVDYGNAHTNYKFSQLLNDHNHKDIEKNMLKVKLFGFNHNIIRGSRLRVEIYIDRAASYDADINRTDDESDETQSNKLSDYQGNPETVLRDRFLSDAYYVKTINYSYMNGIFETDLLLTKRNWIPSIKNKIET